MRVSEKPAKNTFRKQQTTDNQSDKRTPKKEMQKKRERRQTKLK